MLIALVVVATVDSVPDPPAESRDFAQLTISCPHELAADFAAASLVFVPRRIEMRPFRGVPCVTAPAPADRIVPREQETDPSPPRLLS